MQCVTVVTEVINYFKNNGSSVYMCIVEASKAFDRVNLLTLFKTLYPIGMCLIYLKILSKKGNNAVTDYFVKQGGVLYPVLFSMYLYQPISQLRPIGISCYMNSIILLAPSRSSLALVLDQYDSFRNTWHFVQRYKYMIFKHRGIINMDPMYFKD